MKKENRRDTRGGPGAPPGPHQPSPKERSTFWSTFGPTGLVNHMITIFSFMPYNAGMYAQNPKPSFSDSTKSVIKVIVDPILGGTAKNKNLKPKTQYPISINIYEFN